MLWKVQEKGDCEIQWYKRKIEDNFKLQACKMPWKKREGGEYKIQY